MRQIKSHSRANFIQSIRQFIPRGLRKVTWVKFPWVQAIYNPKDKLHVKTCFPIQSYKQIMNSQLKRVIWSKLSYPLQPGGTRSKNSPSYEGTKITRLLSCLLSLLTRSQKSSHTASFVDCVPICLLFWGVPWTVRDFDGNIPFRTVCSKDSHFLYNDW